MLADDEPGASEPVADDEIEAEHEQQQREGRLQEAVDRARNPAQPEQSHHFEDTEYVCVEGGGCVEGVEGVENVEVAPITVGAKPAAEGRLRR